MNVIELPLTDVRPYWRNPRLNDKAVDAVKESISRFGFNSPLIVDAENVIIAGHTRYKALTQMGFKTAPCVVVDLPPDKAKAYRVADNKTSELAEWNMANLLPELREIADVASMQVFFGDDDLAALLKASVGAVDFMPVTQEEIDNVAAEHSARYEDQNTALKSDFVDVTCPHCGESYAIRRSEVQSAKDAIAIDQPV